MFATRLERLFDNFIFTCRRQAFRVLAIVIKNFLDMPDPPILQHDAQPIFVIFDQKHLWIIAANFFQNGSAIEKARSNSIFIK